MWLRILPLLSLLAGAQADKWSRAGCAEPNAKTLAALAARNIQIYEYTMDAGFACNLTHYTPADQIQFTCADKDSQPEVTGKCVPTCTKPDQAELNTKHVKVTYRTRTAEDLFADFMGGFPVLSCKDGYGSNDLQALPCNTADGVWTINAACSLECAVADYPNPPANVVESSWPPENNFFVNEIRNVSCAPGFANFDNGDGSRFIKMRCLGDENEAAAMFSYSGECVTACTEMPESSLDLVASSLNVAQNSYTTTVQCNPDAYYEGNAELTCNVDTYRVTTPCPLTEDGETCSDNMEKNRGTVDNIITVILNLTSVPPCIKEKASSIVAQPTEQLSAAVCTLYGTTPTSAALVDDDPCPLSAENAAIFDVLASLDNKTDIINTLADKLNAERAAQSSCYPPQATDIEFNQANCTAWRGKVQQLAAQYEEELNALDQDLLDATSNAGNAVDPNENGTDEADKSGLGTGGIVGLAVGIPALIALIAFISHMAYKKYKQRQEEKNSNAANSPGSYGCCNSGSVTSCCSETSAAGGSDFAYAGFDL